MADMTRCRRCGGENPADARFCIDCGAAMGEATTGPTTKLAGVPCPSCGAGNPENARFCVRCGLSLAGDGATAPQPAPARPAPPPRPAAPRPTARQSYPRTATPPTLIPYRPSMPPMRRARPAGNPGNWIFLIGLLVLLANGDIWPGILIVIGISMLFNQIARGRPDKGLSALIWLGGLALMLSTGFFWPGILVLLIISALLGGWAGPGRWNW